MSVSDYIIDSKSIMFLVLSQRHFKLVFDYSYFLYSCNKRVVFNYCFGECECTLCLLVFILFLY